MQFAHRFVVMPHLAPIHHQSCLLILEMQRAMEGPRVCAPGEKVGFGPEPVAARGWGRRAAAPESDRIRASASASASSADAHVAAITSQLRTGGPNSVGMMKSVSEGSTTLKNEQAKLRSDRMHVAAELRNAQRRKQCLRTKARQVSNEDILAVMLMRQEQGPMRAADENEKAPACSSLATGSGSAPKSSSPAPMREQD